MHEAILYERLEGDEVRCRLCAHGCTIGPGKRGICQVRVNEGGVLYSTVYGRLIAASADPIEKKPLYQFLPGSKSYSIATVGCNFQCGFCQNWQISQHPRLNHGDTGRGGETPPERVVDQAVAEGCASISYTYTEPTIFFEYARDCMRRAKERGLKNVFVTNGYQSAECIENCRGLLDAANVDLKSMRDEFYRTECKAKLKPVLATLRRMHEAGIWLEVTTLLIPGKNDDPGELRELTAFIAEELSPTVPWHVSAYTPRYQYEGSGIGPTPPAALNAALEIGRAAGLKFVYVGNVYGHITESTFCPACGAELISRSGFMVERDRLRGGACPECGEDVPGVWS